MRTAFLLVVLLSLLATANAAVAGKRDPEWNPPKRFDHAYSGNLTVRYLPQKQVIKACKKLFAKYNIVAETTLRQHGCAAITSDTSCTVIVINKMFALATPKAVVRHEVGHCNGWPADHPN